MLKNIMPTRVEEHHDYVAYIDVRIPMKDGAELSTNIFFPSKDGHVDFDRQYPVILNRTAYLGIHGAMLCPYPTHLMYYATENGFVFVQNAVRGTYLSDGEFKPMDNEGWGEHEDGRDTVEWIRNQSWCNGKIAMTGASYLGGTQYALTLTGDVPGLETCVITVPAMNSIDGGWIYANEFFDVNTAPLWAVQMAVDLVEQRRLPEETIRKIREDLPLLGNLAALDVPGLLQKYSLREFPVARHIPFYQDWLDHRDDPAYFSYNDTRNRRHDFPRPLLYVAGWYDLFGENAINGYCRSVQDAPDEATASGHRLIIGPWFHGYVPSVRRFPEAETDQRLFNMDWIRQQVYGETSEFFSKNPVSIFVMGVNRWRGENQWPLPDTVPTRYYLHANGPANTMEGFGTLSTEMPGEEPADVYVYDPLNPIVIAGGHQVSGGAVDQRPAELRSDVLVYTSEPLEADMEVTGEIRAKLYAATSAEDTDFFIKLVDVCPDGTAYNISTGGRRARYLEGGREHPAPVEPGRIYEYGIKMRPTSYVFKKGHCIRVDICSSDLNNYDLNPNTFTDLSNVQKSDCVAATQTIYHDAAHPAWIELPLVPATHECRWIDEWPYSAKLTGIDTFRTLRPTEFKMENEPQLRSGSKLGKEHEQCADEEVRMNPQISFMKY